MMARFAFAAMAAILLALPAQAVPAPKVKLASIADLPVVVMRPYNEAANADAQVAAAFDRAKKNGKRVLIDLGGNWCGDCVVLANIMLLPELKRFIAAHFEVVSVDTGRNNKNLQILAPYGVTLAGGVPAVLIVEPGTKRLIDAGHISALEDARHMTPQGLADWLAQWAK